MHPNYYPHHPQQVQTQPSSPVQTTPVVGNKHPDTVDFDDFQTHSMMNGYPKITKLAVWSSQMIHGIRVWYSLNGNPAADAKNFKKKEIKKGCTKQVFPLDTDEFIVSLSGRSGAVLDHLTIVTSKGKRLDVGGSGGNPFDLQIPQGFTIGAFKGGYGGHIHNLGGILVPIVMPQQPGYQPQPGYAPMPPQQPGGYPPMQQPGYAPMPPQQPGYAPMPQPGYAPMPPQQPGGYPGYAPMPPQQPGGYPQQPMPPFNPQGAYPQYPAQPQPPQILPPTKSNSVGRSHGDTRGFDDSTFAQANARIVEITGYFNNFCVGFDVTYEMNGQLSTQKHVGSDMGGVVTQKLQLDRDEFVSQVSGRAGDIMDQLHIRTNKGKELVIGGQGGNQFSLNIPQGKRVVGFAGGLGGHIHNLSVYFV